MNINIFSFSFLSELLYVCVSINVLHCTIDIVYWSQMFCQTIEKDDKNKSCLVEPTA